MYYIYIEAPQHDKPNKELTLDIILNSSVDFVQNCLSKDFNIYACFWFDSPKIDSKINNYFKIWKYLENKTDLDLSIGIKSEELVIKKNNLVNYLGVLKLDKKNLKFALHYKSKFNCLIFLSKIDYVKNPHFILNRIEGELLKDSGFFDIPTSNMLIKRLLTANDMIVDLRQYDDIPCVQFVKYS